MRLSQTITQKSINTHRTNCKNVSLWLWSHYRISIQGRNQGKEYINTLKSICHRKGHEHQAETKEIYNNPIPNSKVNELKEYLLKKLKKLDGTKYTKLEEIVKLAKKKRTSKSEKGTHTTSYSN